MWKRRPTQTFFPRGDSYEGHQDFDLTKTQNLRLKRFYKYLRNYTQDCLFRTSETAINESPAFVAKQLQRKPMAISSGRFSSPL